MDAVQRDFYRNFYLRTGGFIPAWPLGQPIYPGDFFQIANGEMVVLGNIFMNSIVDRQEAEFTYGIKLNAANWSFCNGVTKPYSGRGSGKSALGDDFEFSKQILAFRDSGSFIFKGDNPEAVKIANWNSLQQQLIIKLTQTLYSFREVYIATETATTSDWTLAIAGAEKAELEIATDAENFGLVDIFGHPAAKTIQTRDIEFYHRAPERKPCFFKARKLVVQDGRTEAFISELISRRAGQDEWANGFYQYDFYYDSTYTPHVPPAAHISLLDMLQANELNPNTALSYFRWVEVSLDDIGKLFFRHGC